MKTLLIAPKSSSRQLLRDALEQRRHEVESIAEVDAARGALASGGFELIVLATETFDGEAAAVCRRIRAMASNDRCHLLAVGPACAAEHIDALLDAGADDYLVGLDDARRLDVRLAVAERRLAALPGCCSDTLAPVHPPSFVCATVRNAPCGVFRADIDGKLLAVNPALVAMLDYDEEQELLGRDVKEAFFHDPSEHPALLAELVEHGAIQVEVTWKRKDGTPLVVLGSGRTVRNDNGRETHIEGFVVDLSAQKKAETAHEASQTRMRHLLAACPAVFHVCVPDGDVLRTTYISENVALIQGHDPRDYTDCRGFWHEHVHPDDLRNPEPWQKVYETGRHVAEYRFRYKDGTYHWTRHEMNVFRDPDGRSRELLGFWTDITEQRAAEAAWRETEKTVREAEQRFKSIFDHSADGIILTDARDGSLLSANRAMGELLGYPLEELAGLAVEDIHPPEVVPRAQAEFSEHLVGTRTLSHDMPLLRSDGAILFVNISTFPISVDGLPCLAAIFRDITEQKLAADRLRESESRFRLITENVTDMIWTATVEGLDRLASENHPLSIDLITELLTHWRFTYVSPSAEPFLGYRPDEMLQMSLLDLLDAESIALAKRLFIEELTAERQGAEPGRIRVVTLKHRAKDGSIRHGEVKGTFLRDDNNRITGILGVTRDITERRKALDALRKSEATLRSLFENLPDLVILVDREGIIQFINHDVAGMAAEELVGRPGFGFLAPESRRDCQKSLERVVASGQIQAGECLDVFGLHWAFRLVPLVEDGELHRVMVICTDITEQARASRALKKEQRLLRQLLDLHERDRQLTAYEIHDGFSQYLTGALFNLQGFRELHAKKPAESWKTFDSGLAMIRRSIDETRRLIGGLRPPILDESGVVDAIEYLACEAEESREAEIEFTHDVQFDRLAPPLESAIFRIVQESLTNARRHSKSAKILINLRQDGERIHVSVRDWGVGFCPSKIEEGRFGLQGIRERVRLFDGQITIVTAPDEGTYVRVELPLVQAAGTPVES